MNSNLINIRVYIESQAPTCSIGRFHFVLRVQHHRRRHNRQRHRQRHPLVVHTLQVTNAAHAAHADHSLRRQNTAHTSAVTAAHTAAGTRSAARSASRAGSRADEAHRLRRCRCGRRGHVVVGVRMWMGHIVVAGVTHRGVSRERIAGGLDRGDDSAAAKYLGELVGLKAKVEGLCWCTITE